MHNKKIKIVRMCGGLGNQMFQYAFGKSLENLTNSKVLFDLSWFDEAKKTMISNTGRNAGGICIREFEINVLPNINIEIAKKEDIDYCMKNNMTSFFRKILRKPTYLPVTREKNAFIFQKNLLSNKKNQYYFEGYFQNENYFKNIKEQIKYDFQLPKLKENDNYNKELLEEIKFTKDSVFIHVRREDYIKLDWLITENYYKNAVKYMQEHLENPTFFVFCAEDPQYIKDNFDIGTKFKLIGEKNKTRESFYENMRLMMSCKHAIIANSSYSWWAAWLSDYEGKIVIAPSPWINGQDEIVCDRWIKIENKRA